MTTQLAYEEETLWRNLHAPESSVPFIECAEALTCVRRGTGPVDGSTVQDAVAGIVQRHAVLRSCFPASGTGAVREHVPIAEHPIRVLDFSDLPEDDRRRHAARVVHTELRAPFDVASGPLYRAAWITLDPERQVLAFAAHHLVFDMTSAHVVSRELDACLGARSAALPPEPARYSDYVTLQRRQLEGATIARLRTFWMRQLDGLSDVRVARTSPSDGHSTRSQIVRFTIDPVEGAALRRLSKGWRISIATTLLGLLAIVLHEMTDSTDIVIGVPVSCRPPNGFESTVGLFVNLVAVRSDLSTPSDLSGLLRRLWSSVLEAYQHRAFPYECLVDALGARTGTGPPPFRVVFNYATPSPFELVPSDFPRGDEPPRQGPPSFADLSLHTRDTGTSLECCVIYKSDLLHESEIADLTTRFRRLAREVARDPDRAVSQLVHP